MTLIAVYNSEGLVGRCDAKCYNASSRICEGICGGKNHGVGFTTAHDNTREYCEQWLEAYAAQNGLTDWTAEVPAHEPIQQQLL